MPVPQVGLLERIGGVFGFKSRTVSAGAWLILIATWLLLIGKIEADHWENVVITCLFIIAGRTVALPMIARARGKGRRVTPTNEDLANED
jgi:hypothetical protein